MSTTTTVKTTGAIWNLFYADKTAWHDGAYHDDVLVAVNGKEDPDTELENLPQDAAVEIRSGYVVLSDGSDADLGDHFKNWEAEQSGQSMALGTFRARKDKLEAVRQAILDAGGELIP